MARGLRWWSRRRCASGWCGRRARRWRSTRGGTPFRQVSTRQRRKRRSSVLASYPATYCDRHGAEATTITNDGRWLRMRVRGVQFAGDDFDAFQPDDSSAPSEMESFTLEGRYLCGCSITCAIPVPVMAGDHLYQGTLHVQLDLGEPRADRRG